MENQTNIFEMLYDTYKITKPIRMIEFFAGYGSTKLAWDYLGIDVESYKICEWAIKSIQAYKDIHCPGDNTNYSKDLSTQEIKDYLFKKGISQNYNEPMGKSQIDRLSDPQVRTIYNNIKATHNLVNIQQVKGSDLEIKDTDKYEYILSYSFPCQDLSLAGKGKGMSDTSTRSGMLWEVERILTECETKPQILLMENVPQVHGEGNKEDFIKWQLRLEELGYSNYWQDLIATDFGIPQTRNRCFMISILGDYNYTFPKPIPLKLKLKDLLEDVVDEKYYLSDKQISDIQTWNAYEKPLENMEKTDQKNISPTLTTRSGAYAAGMILVKNATKKGYLEASDGDGVDISSRMEHHRGTVQKGKTQTLTTMGGENNGVVVEDTLQTQPKEGVVTIGNYSPSNHNASRIVDSNGLAPTVMENHGTVTATNVYSESEKELFTEDGNIKRYIDSDIVDKFEEGQMATTTFPNGYGHGPRTHDNSIALNTIDKPSVKHNLRIRKLTPKECFRLMGVKDSDYEKCAKNQSNASLYHLAGDSIVVDVIKAIYKQLI
jgi:DNA (cytosine-5)-methyltransferase 1